MNKFASASFAFIACMLGQENGWSVREIGRHLSLSHRADDNYSQLQSSYFNSLHEFNAKFQGYINEIKSIDPVSPLDCVGYGVTSLLKDFGEKNGINVNVFYNLTNHMYLLNWNNRIGYLNKIGLGEGIHEPRNFEIGFSILKDNFEKKGTSFEQKCFLLSKMRRWLGWLEDACENDWWQANKYLYIEVEFEYSVMFLEALLSFYRGGCLNNCSGNCLDNCSVMQL